MAALNKAPSEATPYDWMLLAAIVAFGGSSFVMIRSAVETIPPAIVGPVNTASPARPPDGACRRS